MKRAIYHNSVLIRELLLSMVMAYTLTMHWMLFLLFSALLGVSLGQMSVKQESNPVSQELLCETTTLAPFLCMTRQFTRYLKGFWVDTNFSIMISLISLIQPCTYRYSYVLGPRYASTVSRIIFSIYSLGKEIYSSSYLDITKLTYDKY